MCKAMGGVYRKMPDANAILRFGRIYLRERVGVFFQAVIEDSVTGEYDLSGLTIHDPERKSLVEIVDEFETRVEKVRTGKDRELEQSRSIFKRLPILLLRPVLDFMGFVSFGLNFDLRRFGIPKDPFGSLMITNIGTLGIDEAYVPLVPYSRVPLLIAMGAVQEVPVVKDGAIVVGKVMRLNVTFDHRVLDGAHAAIMARTLQDYFSNPFERFDTLPVLTP
jgi:pyruvate dehydrogenase E2 component (dihydrolipoamide acetyltransferase)